VLAELEAHIAREEYDLFPATLLAIPPRAWDAAEQAAARARLEFGDVPSHPAWGNVRSAAPPSKSNNAELRTVIADFPRRSGLTPDHDPNEPRAG
jgi:hypothetical protein